MEYENEVEELKELVKHYKFASESFEKRVLDLQMQLSQKDEEIKSWKDKYEAGLAVRKVSSFQNLAEGEEPLSMRKLFVGGLPQEATGELLSEYFSSYGTVHDATVVKDNATQKSRGFGFVVFTQSSMTDLAQSARPHKILGKEVDTKRAIPKSTIEAGLMPKNPNIQSHRVFIGGLRQSTTSDMIRDYFTRYGEVLTVDLIEDLNNGKSRGFAYVTFSDSDSTDKVIVQKFHSIDSRKCEAKPAFHKMAKTQFQEQMPPHNPNYNDFQALFGAFQQQMFGGGGGGNFGHHLGNHNSNNHGNNTHGNNHSNNNTHGNNNNNKAGPSNGGGGDDKDENTCYHCDNEPTDADAWNNLPSPYMNLDANYQNQYRNYFNNFRNPKNKPAYFTKPKPY